MTGFSCIGGSAGVLTIHPRMNPTRRSRLGNTIARRVMKLFEFIADDFTKWGWEGKREECTVFMGTSTVPPPLGVVQEEIGGRG